MFSVSVLIVGSVEQCVDEGHALVLEGSFYGTEVNITCLKQPCLFAVPLCSSAEEW